MKVSLKGILQAHIEDLSVLPEIAPKGFIYLNAEDLHITLLTMKELYPANLEFRNDWNYHHNNKVLPPFPAVRFAETPYIVDNGEKRSWVLDLDEWSQHKVWNWLYEVLYLMDLEKEVQPSKRVFHVSLANATGSKFDSVPDPWNHKK